MIHLPLAITVAARWRRRHWHCSGSANIASAVSVPVVSGTVSGVRNCKLNFKLNTVTVTAARTGQQGRNGTTGMVESCSGPDSSGPAVASLAIDTSDSLRLGAGNAADPGATNPDPQAHFNMRQAAARTAHNLSSWRAQAAAVGLNGSLTHDEALRPSLSRVDSNLKFSSSTAVLQCTPSPQPASEAARVARGNPRVGASALSKITTHSSWAQHLVLRAVLKFVLRWVLTTYFI
jgi:hypothetical protein